MNALVGKGSHRYVGKEFIPLRSAAPTAYPAVCQVGKERYYFAVASAAVPISVNGNVEFIEPVSFVFCRKNCVSRRFYRIVPKAVYRTYFAYVIENFVAGALCGNFVTVALDFYFACIFADALNNYIDFAFVFDILILAVLALVTLEYLF